MKTEDDTHAASRWDNESVSVTQAKYRLARPVYKDIEGEWRNDARSLFFAAIEKRAPAALLGLRQACEGRYRAVLDALNRLPEHERERVHLVLFVYTEMEEWSELADVALYPHLSAPLAALRSCLVAWTEEWHLDAWHDSGAAWLRQRALRYLASGSGVYHTGILAEAPLPFVPELRGWWRTAETRTEAQSRIRAEFEVALDAYLDRCEQAAAEDGDALTPMKREIEHFDWLVRRQVLGQWYTEIARAVYRERQSVEGPVRDAARMIGLTLRPSKPGRPRKTVK